MYTVVMARALMCLYVSVCLLWPFVGKVKLELLNQFSDSNH